MHAIGKLRGGGAIRLSAAVLTALLLAVSPASAEEPPAPVLSATPGDGKVDLSWTDTGSGDGGPDTYFWRMKLVGSNWDNPTFAGSVTTETVTGLTNDHTYRFQVRARRLSTEVQDDPPSNPGEVRQPTVTHTWVPGPWSTQVEATPAAE